MSSETVRRIADAVLYEGYLLYPYRPSSIKNRQRWTFGGLYPKPYAQRNGDASSFHSEMLLKATGRHTADVRIRFLHLLSEVRSSGTWQLAVEREVPFSHLTLNLTHLRKFSFPGSHRVDAGVARTQEQVDGLVEISSEPLSHGLFKLGLRVNNQTGFHGSLDVPRDEASMQALVAAHAIVHVAGGEFLSSTDPPDDAGPFASRCSHQGVWPVLAVPDSREWMLLSPIILSDFPEIAPESPGDLFDGTEIDEILTLRILTMTEQEKQEMRDADPRARRLLDRTESLSERDLMKLHGALRNPHLSAARMPE
jgi:hypothetical protein